MAQLRLFSLVEAPMAELTETQRTVQRLVHEIGKLGGFVVSAPLANPIRFQTLDSDCEAIISTLASWGWEPTHCNAGLRFCPDGTAKPCATYQLTLQPERQVIVDDRKIHGELATGEKVPSEMQLIVDEWYAKKRRQRW
jgi:hypothetical protein